jgi:hypothetical protein
VIIRLLSAGKSFKGLGRYLAHDADRASTANRVEWTHTLNLANDDVGSAIDEMLWTYRAADQLKRVAGIRPGSHPLKNPVKHVSLGWDRSDPQTREHMIETVKAYLEHMGWAEHQAVIFCHNDRHPHVHLMINAVHPETGRALDDGHERRRSQRFALGYEFEQGKIFCEQRLLPEDERERAPTREAWMKMKEAERAHQQAENALMLRAPDYFDRHDPVAWKAKEWEALRGYQKEQRTAFFAHGKQAYRKVRNAVFREVRTEFRDEWKTWFDLRREGFDPHLLGEIKKGILERQNAELEKRRDEACKELRERRDHEYEDILRQQREQRAELRARQDDGLRSFDLLDHQTAGDRTQQEQRDRSPLHDEFTGAARETTSRRDEREEEAQPHEPELREGGHKERHRVRDPLDAAGLIGLGALGAIAEIGERLFDGFLGGAARPAPKPQPKRSREERAHQPRSTEAQQRSEEALATEAARLQEFWEQRRRSRTRDRD